MDTVPDFPSDCNPSSSLLSGVLVFDQTQSMYDAVQTAQLLETFRDAGPLMVIQKIWCWKDVRVLLATTLN